jgi:hypothetical protein
VTANRTAAEVAMQFESLGGGSLNPNGWAFGCEFGFWQRSLGLEPLGLLRWASISAENLLLGLEAGFQGVDDENELEVREHTGDDWGATQITYGIHLDHSHLNRLSVTREAAKFQISRNLRFLRRKLIEDLKSAEKMFVFRTYDHDLEYGLQRALAMAISKYNESGILFYVQLAPRGSPVFSATRTSPNLIVGYIDHFAPRNGKLIYNPHGWEQVCRAALELVQV